MTLTDTLIPGREAVLNRILGVLPDETLNTGPSDYTPQAGADIAAQLKRAVNALKAAAMDPTGRHVDYAHLRQSQAYATYRVSARQLQSLDPGTLATREERLAFWANLYNSLVIDAVITFGVQRSVTQGCAGGLAFFRRAAYDVGGQRFSADDIEHGILRGNRGHVYIPGPQFGPSDARRAWVVSLPHVRIHFALTCASRSCPPIGVYDADHMDAQLDLAARSFVDADVALDKARGEVRLSTIFRWFAGDFGGRPGIAAFLLRHLPGDERREWLEARGSLVRLAYHPYNWTLNTRAV